MVGSGLLPAAPIHPVFDAKYTMSVHPHASVFPHSAATFALRVYGDDPCECFKLKAAGGTDKDEQEMNECQQ